MGEVFAARYELADPIGRGGVGAVWRAWDHRRRRYVAAKVLQQSDAHALLRFVREQALRIDHPHVLAPASWAADDDKVLFTMDLVAGGSLVHLVNDYGPLPPVFVCTLLDQLLAGLTAVHAEGVVHRDIKPANILLEATGTGRPRLRLSDFGIAMRLGEPRLTDTNLVVGTPGYLAPEQMLGADPDFPADLFAVGLVALYLLEGAKPDAKALVQYFTEHGTPSAPKTVPEPLWQVVATLLQPDPQARFRSATGARKALAAAVELLPEPGPDDEMIEIFDQLGPLPPGFGPEGPSASTRGAASPLTRPGVADGAVPGTARPDAGSLPLRPETIAPGSAPRGNGSLSSGTAWPGTGAPAEPGSGTGANTGTSTDMGTGTGAGTDTGFDARADSSTGSGSAWPGTDSVPVDPRRARHPSMSDTGSFHLPPPQPTGTSSPAPTHTPAQPAVPRPPAYAPPPAPLPAAPHAPQGSPAPSYAPEPTFALPSQGGHHPDSSTASYTAQDPGSPQPPQSPQSSQTSQAPQFGQVSQVSQASQHGRRRRGHRAVRRERSGPPVKVAVPMLLLALACYAVGFWALARI
ncbi:protein kinase [Streptomyces sp. IBSBF 2953]|uniref:serine/threonine-protein kinase n=1 Tax=Streptomyces TaxID=1883 RepID=UPI00211A5094|nr:serine/threonine protein kinase [Streptomyces scabiei]MCQ9182822.1 protein kinase [Streptomyces hayashii]MDX3117702.1 protein kinase [Streptomyces scabiei]